jgi:hypothetical protein
VTAVSAAAGSTAASSGLAVTSGATAEAASLFTAAVLPQAVSAMAAASSRAVILVIFMDLLPSYNKKYRYIFKTTTVLYQILW